MDTVVYMVLISTLPWWMSESILFKIKKALPLTIHAGWGSLLDSRIGRLWLGGHSWLLGSWWGGGNAVRSSWALVRCNWWGCCSGGTGGDREGVNKHSIWQYMNIEKLALGATGKKATVIIVNLTLLYLYHVKDDCVVARRVRQYRYTEISCHHSSQYTHQVVTKFSVLGVVLVGS